jgi:hypothetical protein
MAALITDLRQRGMLDDTIVVFGSEFGRTPTAQGSGRDHHLAGFTMWFAGGGFKGGTSYGATDEFGYHAVGSRCTTFTRPCCIALTEEGTLNESPSRSRHSRDLVASPGDRRDAVQRQVPGLGLTPHGRGTGKSNLRNCSPSPGDAPTDARIGFTSKPPIARRLRGDDSLTVYLTARSVTDPMGIDTPGSAATLVILRLNLRTSSGRLYRGGRDRAAYVRERRAVSLPR